jgi:small neutral amino acid transporter SnatA (MarC family)
MSEFLRSSTLLLVLLNPFLVIVYLLDVIQKLDFRVFSLVMIRATIISLVVFYVFAAVGNAVFSDVVQAEFASFQIFGGIVFLLIAIQFVFRGSAAIELLRGESKHLAGAIAMPVMIGPGTISASVVIGQRLPTASAISAITLGVLVSVLVMLLLKRLHDYVRPRREELVERYIEVTGRITALFVGTISVDMIMRGVRVWAEKF